MPLREIESKPGKGSGIARHVARLFCGASAGVLAASDEPGEAQRAPVRPLPTGLGPVARFRWRFRLPVITSFTVRVEITRKK